MYLTQTLKIEILMMIGFGERKRTQKEVSALFLDRHQQFRVLGHVGHILRRRPRKVSETKLDSLLAY